MADNKNTDVNNELKRLKDTEVDEVSGGVFRGGEDHADGHELSCVVAWHSENECKKSPDGYHYWEEVGKKKRCLMVPLIFHEHTSWFRTSCQPFCMLP